MRIKETEGQDELRDAEIVDGRGGLVSSHCGTKTGEGDGVAGLAITLTEVAEMQGGEGAIGAPVLEP